MHREPISFLFTRFHRSLRIHRSPDPVLRIPVQRRVLVRLFLGPDGALLLLSEESLDIDPGVLGPLGLSRRETEVLAWVAKGKTDAEVASIVGARPRTVGKHLERIYQKLGVENRTGAAAKAFETAALARWRTRLEVGVC